MKQGSNATTSNTLTTCYNYQKLINISHVPVEEASIVT